MSRGALGAVLAAAAFVVLCVAVPVLLAVLLAIALIGLGVIALAEVLFSLNNDDERTGR